MSAPISPQAIAASDTLSSPVLAPDGSKVLYTVRPLYKAHDKEHATSAIWIADASKEGSARQLTSGLFNDTSAVFSHDGETVYFLSDRHKAGGSPQLYSLPLSVGGEAIPLTGTELKRHVSSFKLSPDGRFIAYTSAGEPTAEDDAKEKAKDDAIVFSDRKKLNKLRLLRLATRTTVSFNLPERLHAWSFTWNPDGDKLVVSMIQHSRLEMMGVETKYFSVDIHDPAAEPTLLMSYQDAMADGLTWLSDGSLLELRFYNPDTVTSARAVVNVHGLQQGRGKAAALYAGINDDAERLVDLRHDNRVAVEISAGLESRIDIITSTGKLVHSVYQTHEDALGAWDIKRLGDGSYAFACIRSSSPRREGPNIWYGKLSPSASTTPAPANLTKLSTHAKWLEDSKTNSKTEAFAWTARDGTKLEGIISKPVSAPGPLPTILVVHGGPYYRDTLHYNITCSGWREYLAAAGFCTLSPNYRGGSGRGSAFAEAARGGMGTVDWTDCEDMLNAALDRGIADPKRLGIAGWSQGGFMTACGVALTKNKFKAACMGAGVSDWGSMSEESDLPDFETALAGGAPWSSPPIARRDPIASVKDVETAVLIIHGEKDERVPVGQAVGYYRGLKREAKYPERSDLVIYPREPHGFNERTHAQDVLQRVLDHFTTWLL
ncbi:alpha/beta-hydrolase [Auricularia subglabra TFB-10046 SS5]|nr:alpha/beta-hydrolase [Auricularia subglabra TFB-10046 SS5]